MRIAPKKVRICPACPPKELNLDIAPKFTFVLDSPQKNQTISIVGNLKNKSKGLKNSLF